MSYGFDANLSVKKSFFQQKLDFELIQKTALTVAKDYTDKRNSTYQQQIPYTPYWNYAGEFIVRFFGASVAWESSFNGFRFVLGENIFPNMLNGYWLHHLRLAYDVSFKRDKHTFRIYVVLNNLSNVQYQVIRSFPMPGRSIEIGIKYAWNKKK
jgi:outer membrane cobalamin receptor